MRLALLLAFVALALAACAQAAPGTLPTPSPQTADAEKDGGDRSNAVLFSVGPDTVEGGQANACAYRAPEPTPTADLTTPTPTPFPTATPVGATPTPTRPSADVLAYPELPPPTLPASVEAWQDAIVHVSVELARGYTRDQQGLVVADGAVLTVLDVLEEVSAITVEVPGRGASPAVLRRFDPRTGAALLAIDANGLVVAPAESTGVLPGEPVLLLSRREGSGLKVEESFASPSVNAEDDLFALLVRYAPYQQPGTIVITRDGTPVGMAAGAWSWFGVQFVSGPAPGPDQPAVLLRSAQQLIEEEHPNASVIPAAVAYQGQSWGKFVDGPVTREMMAASVHDALRGLGEQVSLEGLGRRAGYAIANKPGTFLELLYATPQQVLDEEGNVVGLARYIVLWWDRGEGQPDLVLCGTEPNHLGAAFATDGLDSLEEAVARAPQSTRSIVQAQPLPGSQNEYEFSTYSYPYVWTLRPDKEAYLPGETVTLTFTATNISQWPMPLDYLPPTVVFRSEIEHRNVAALAYGAEHRTLEPGETVSLTITWDQAAVAGRQAPPGSYVAEVRVANAAWRCCGLPGPRATIALMPSGGALDATLTLERSVTDNQVVATLRSVEFAPGSTVITVHVESTGPVFSDGRGMPERACAEFSVDAGPAETVANRGYAEEGDGVRMIWELPPVPADTQTVNFAINRIGDIPGRWAFAIDLKGAE